MKPDFCICENKGADQLCSNLIANSSSIFVTYIVQCLFRDVGGLVVEGRTLVRAVGGSILTRVAMLYP